MSNNIITYGIKLDINYCETTVKNYRNSHAISNK